jgi:hypothetical protein
LHGLRLLKIAFLRITLAFHHLLKILLDISECLSHRLNAIRFQLKLSDLFFGVKLGCSTEFRDRCYDQFVGISIHCVYLFETILDYIRHEKYVKKAHFIAM